MRRLRHLAGPFRAFRRAEDGSYTVEALLVMPLLVWAFLATHVFFDAYHKRLLLTKASHTIADLLSRRNGDSVDQAFLSGLNDLLNELTLNRVDARMRVTTTVFDEGDDEKPDELDADDVFRWQWSCAPVEGCDPVDQDYVDEVLAPQLPVPGDEKSIIIVEVWATYTTVSAFGLPQTIRLADVIPIASRDGQLQCDDCATPPMS